MRFIDYIVIALRNIIRQKLRSALTIFAVVIGATSVTIMLALVFGAKSFFMQQMNANGTLQQIAISAKADIENFDDAGHGNQQCDSCVKLTDDIVSKVKNVTHVTGVSRQSNSGMFEAVTFGDKKLTLDNIIAYDGNEVIKTNVVAGRNIQDGDKDNVVVLTADYADKFGFKDKYQDIVGKELKLQSRDFYQGEGSYIQTHEPQAGPDGKVDFNGQNQPTTLIVKVVGVIDTSNFTSTMRATMAWVAGTNRNYQWQVTDASQKAAELECRSGKYRNGCPPAKMSLVVQDWGLTNGYSSLTAKVDDVKNAKQATADIKKLGIGAADAESFIKTQLSIFNILGMVLGGIGGIALAVSAVGVVNTMVMAILERTREIGVMRAVGARRSTIRRLFTFEASMLGFWGGVIGVGIGYGLTLIANPIINKQLNSSGMAASNIIGVPLWLALTVIGITTLIGMLAGLYPAMRAARLDPVEALRYE